MQTRFIPRGRTCGAHPRMSVRFLYNHMTRAAAVLALATACFALEPEAVQLRRGEHQIEVAIGGRPFTTYYFSSAVSKPYLMPLETPSGVIVTRPFPVVNDIPDGDIKDKSFEPHQRPLYFGHGNVNGLDFWEEEVFDWYMTDHARQPYGHMVLKKVEQVSQDGTAGTVRARFRLLDPNQRQIAEETQSFTFRGDAQTRTIDCEFVVFATDGPVVFGDAKEGTFAIRLNRDLSKPNDHMLNSLGQRGEPAIWGKPADWVNYSGTVGGKPVGIVVFDAPDSFHHPTPWMAREYGLLAANPFGLRKFTGDKNKDGSWTVPEGQSIRFRYRVVIYDGEIAPDELAQAYAQYAAVK